MNESVELTRGGDVMLRGGPLKSSILNTEGYRESSDFSLLH